jgi:hypothetical protein
MCVAVATGYRGDLAGHLVMDFLGASPARGRRPLALLPSRFHSREGSDGVVSLQRPWIRPSSRRAAPPTSFVLTCCWGIQENPSPSKR